MAKAFEDHAAEMRAARERAEANARAMKAEHELRLAAARREGDDAVAVVVKAWTEKLSKQSLDAEKDRDARVARTRDAVTAKLTAEMDALRATHARRVGELEREKEAADQAADRGRMEIASTTAALRDAEERLERAGDDLLAARAAHEATEEASRRRHADDAIAAA